LLYTRCREVSAKYWEELALLPPAEVARRTGVRWTGEAYRLRSLQRVLLVDPTRRRLQVLDSPDDQDPGFRRCLTTLLYLSRVDPNALGPPVSPLELVGGSTFFQKQGPHALPGANLAARGGLEPASFLAQGRRLGGVPRTTGDAALAFPVFPGLTVEVILWAADEEFPAQISFTVPRGLDRVWHLDAVLGLLQHLAEELLAAGA